MDYINTHKIGDVGEGYAIAKFIEAGCNISIPYTVNVPYDLIVEFNGNLFKIQVKTTEKVRNGSMLFSVGRTNPFKMTNIKYEKTEVDYFFLYCIENGWSGIIKSDNFNSKQLTIRIEPPLNNNYHNCKMSDEYEFSNKIDELKYGNAFRH